jgi:hypothetical protein
MGQAQAQVVLPCTTAGQALRSVASDSPPDGPLRGEGGAFADVPEVLPLALRGSRWLSPLRRHRYAELPEGPCSQNREDESKQGY